MKNNWSALAIMALLIVGCKGDPDPDPNPNPTPTGPIESMDDVSAPDGFTYNMIHEAEIQSVIFGNPYLGKAKVRYYGVHGSRKELLKETTQILRDTVLVTLEMPILFDRILLEATLPDHSYSVGQGQISSEEIMVALPASEGVKEPYEPTFKTSGPGCGCPTVLSSVSGTKLTVASNDTVCITAGLSGKQVEILSGGQLRICGTFSNVNNVELATDASLILNDNSALTLQNGKSFDLADDASVEIYDGATLSVSKLVQLENGATLLNYGTANFSKSVDVLNDGEITNYGTLTIGGDFHLNGATALATNSGFLSTTSNNYILVENGATYTNYCNTYSDHSFTLDNLSTVENYGQIEAYAKLEINDDAVLNMHGGSLALCDDLKFYRGTINGLDGTPSLVKVVDDALWSSNSTATGDVKWCVGDKNQNYSSLNTSGNVGFNCGVYIPTTSCVTVGNGLVDDADGDGVLNPADLYPYDSSRVQDLAGATFSLAFEDTWPNKGDYDFNDFVSAFTLVTTVNQAGHVKDLKVAYKVLARGAAYDNGFGFELDVANSAVQSVSGTVLDTLAPLVGSNGVESANSKASIIVFDNIDDISFSWNTDWTYINPYNDVPWDTVVVTFVNAIPDSSLGVFNPYVIVNGDRGHEVHLPNYPPTSLVDATKFGIGSDASDASQGIYYMTDDNKPWGLLLPIMFEHPIEHEDITQVYLNFGNWANSGGQTNTTWYDANDPSNVDDSKLF